MEGESTEFNFDGLANPILDLEMSGLGLGGDGVVEKDALQETLCAPGNKFKRDNDFSYMQKEEDAMLQDLRDLCDSLGVNCTIPMESQLKRSLQAETMYYSSLVWYVRGIITANQTQIIPTVTGAISDMKMETKYMQQASSKLNKEITRTESVASKIYQELKNVQEEMKESFRSSMKLFMEDVLSTVSANQEAQLGDTRDSKTVGHALKELGGNCSTKHEDPISPALKQNKAVSIEPEPVQVQYIKEKRSRLIRIGLDPQILSSLDDDTIDAIYPDSVHNKLKNTKLSEAICTRLSSQIIDRLEAYLESGSEDDEESNRGDDSETEGDEDN